MLYMKYMKAIWLVLLLCLAPFPAIAELREEMNGIWAQDLDASIAYMNRLTKETGRQFSMKHVEHWRKELEEAGAALRTCLEFSDTSVRYTTWGSGELREAPVIVDERQKRVALLLGKTTIVYTLLDADTLEMSMPGVEKLLIILRRVK